MDGERLAEDAKDGSSQGRLLSGSQLLGQRTFSTKRASGDSGSLAWGPRPRAMTACVCQGLGGRGGHDHRQARALPRSLVVGLRLPSSSLLQASPGRCRVTTSGLDCALLSAEVPSARPLGCASMIHELGRMLQKTGKRKAAGSLEKGKRTLRLLLAMASQAGARRHCVAHSSVHLLSAQGSQ